MDGVGLEDPVGGVEAHGRHQGHHHQPHHQPGLVIGNSVVVTSDVEPELYFVTGAGAG